MNSDDNCDIEKLKLLTDPNHGVNYIHGLFLRYETESEKHCRDGFLM